MTEPATPDPEKVLLGALLVRTRDLRAACDQLEDVVRTVGGLDRAKVDLEALYEALTIGAVLAEAVDGVSPEFLQDRAAAEVSVRAAINSLRRVYSRRGLAGMTDSLDRELELLLECHDKPEERRTLRELSPSSGGRRKALWRKHVIARLRAAGTSIEVAKFLVSAAGLSDKTPQKGV